jgi:protein SCO1/2
MPHGFLRQSFAVVVCALLTSSCGSGNRAASGAGSNFHGAALPAPIRKPSFTLTDFNGKPFDFAAETNDKVALLFFGYTHCPDVCPLHMANIAAVLKEMPWEERSYVRVVFVTTDPERDTPRRLKEWLASFDPQFIGLTGSKDELARAQASLGLASPQREYAGGDSVNYYVGHAAQVYAFARDGFAYLVYPFGIRQEDWANDLPKLARDASGVDVRRDISVALRAQTQAVAPASLSAPDDGSARLVVTQALIAEPASQSEAALYLTIRNETMQEDTLVAVAGDVAVRAELHEAMGSGTMETMAALPAIPLPARAETRLAPGGRHVMLLNLRRALVAGDTATVFVSLARLGTVTVKATVVPYAELQRVLR